MNTPNFFKYRNRIYKMDIKLTNLTFYLSIFIDQNYLNLTY